MKPADTAKLLVGRVLGLALLAISLNLLTFTRLVGQDAAVLPTPTAAVESLVSSCPPANSAADPLNVLSEGCPTCDSCGSCGGNCVPGRPQCFDCESHTAAGRFLCGLYGAICCPDPCYEPKWNALADAAFMTKSARPATHTRIRYDLGLAALYPDRSEYFWPKANGSGLGPKPVSGGESNLKYHELSMYTETGTGKFAMIFDMPYRSNYGQQTGHEAGFGDIVVGHKTLLFDCELLQLSYEFLTHIPSGSANKGLGVGHVSLEPSLLLGVKLGPESYLQAQVTEWIPLGGDADYAGAILHYHFSFNQVAARPIPNTPLIGVLEFSGYSFQDGAYTSPDGTTLPAGGTYCYLTSGLRYVVCDKFDFGFATSFALTSEHLAQTLVHMEVRWRY